MIGPRPCAPARWVLALVVIVLPAVSKDRYREEFRAELPELGWPSQLYQASTLLVGSVSLRRALSGVDVIEELTVARSMWCRLGRHRYRPVQDDNPEMRGRAYLRCERCGKPKDKDEYGPMPGTALGVASL